MKSFAIILSFLILFQFDMAAAKKPTAKKTVAKKAAVKCDGPDLSKGIQFDTGAGIDNPFTTEATFYKPGGGGKEGGLKNSREESANTFREAIDNGWPIGVATDQIDASQRTSKSTFVERCGNKLSEGRCLILMHVPGLWDTLARQGLDMVKRFGNKIPRDTVIAVSEDTGGAFHGKEQQKIDLAVPNAEIAGKGIASKGVASNDKRADAFVLGGLGIEATQSMSVSGRRCFWRKLRRTDLSKANIDWKTLPKLNSSEPRLASFNQGLQRVLRPGSAPSDASRAQAARAVPIKGAR